MLIESKSKQGTEQQAQKAWFVPAVIWVTHDKDDDTVL